MKPRDLRYLQGKRSAHLHEGEPAVCKERKFYKHHSETMTESGGTSAKMIPDQSGLRHKRHRLRHRGSVSISAITSTTSTKRLFWAEKIFRRHKNKIKYIQSAMLALFLVLAIAPLYSKIPKASDTVLTSMTLLSQFCFGVFGMVLVCFLWFC